VVEDQVLEPFVGDQDLFGALHPQSGPAMAGDADPGINLCCAECGTVLASATYPGQFLDLLFRCYECGQLGASPRRQSGQPLAGRPVLIPPGRYRLESTVQTAGRPVMFVGQQAIDGYVFETGLLRPTVPSSPELTAQLLKDLAKGATDLLGERYEGLRASDERGKASPTPPPRRHRLIEIIDYAHEAAGALENHKPDEVLELDGFMIFELHGLMGLFDRWKNHPACKLLAASLKDANDVHHSHILLAVASYLCDLGNGVGLVFEEQPGQRVADLWVEPSLIERLDVEIKTPLEFRGPLASPLTDDGAYKIVERVVKKAASTKSGQLNADFSGIVVFGTFHLSEADTQTIVSACERLLNNQRDRKHHLAAIAVTSFRLSATTVLDSSGAPREAVGPSIETNIVRHPGYTGSLTLEENRPPWQTGFSD
jgi:hypothetical protein